MTETNRVIYPTIDLFSYELAEGLRQRDEEIDPNRKNFWRKIHGKDPTAVQLEDAIKIESEVSTYIELLGTEKKKCLADPLDGFYYPVKLGDTYALQIDCSSNLEDPALEYAPRDIKNFSQIQQNIINLPHQSKNSHCESIPFNYVGQTWFVWAKLASANQSPLTTAKQIYAQLQIFEHPNWEKDLKTEIKTTEAKLLGANCFELWQLPSDVDDLSQSKHLFICLFPNELDIATKEFNTYIANLYPRLMRLFLHRNKIIWAYTLSRRAKNNLRKYAKDIKIFLSNDSLNNNKKRKTDLVELQQYLKSTLTLMTTYAEELIYLEDQKNTIETNLKNYQKQLRQFEDPQQDIDQPFLEKFAEIVTDKYLTQITADLSSLSPAQKSLENSVRNIEGIINIEQAKSDRNLNQTIFIVGTSLGTSQVAASIIVAQFPANTDIKDLNYQPLNYIWVFVFSILIGMSFGGFLWWIMWIMRSRNSKKT